MLLLGDGVHPGDSLISPSRLVGSLQLPKLGPKKMSNIHIDAAETYERSKGHRYERSKKLLVTRASLLGTFLLLVN